jgi:hypothetical protein
MMNMTGLVVFASLLVMLMWDLAVVAIKLYRGEPLSTDPGKPGSIWYVSQFITDCSAKPRIAFVLGVLLCHLFGWMMFPTGQ